jgi:TonB family protein
MYGATRREAIHTPAALALIVAALIVGACSKGEPESKQVKPNAPIEIAGRQAATGQPDATVDEALKDRLARQEAASRMFERNVLQPPAPRAAEPKPTPAAPATAPASAPVQAAAPAASEPARPPATVAAATPSPEPVKAAPPPVAQAPAPTPAPAAPPKSAPPRVNLAAAKPSAAPEPTTPRILSRVEPDFPTEAARAGVEHGTVLAKLTIDGAGNVTQVEILNANPRRVFDRSVVRALGQWKFNEGAAGRTIESEIAFRK